jgi:hypothetical protein
MRVRESPASALRDEIEAFMRAKGGDAALLDRVSRALSEHDSTDHGSSSSSSISSSTPRRDDSDRSRIFDRRSIFQQIGTSKSIFSESLFRCPSYRRILSWSKSSTSFHATSSTTRHRLYESLPEIYFPPRIQNAGNHVALPAIRHSAQRDEPQGVWTASRHQGASSSSNQAQDDLEFAGIETRHAAFIARGPQSEHDDLADLFSRAGFAGVALLWLDDGDDRDSDDDLRPLSSATTPRSLLIEGSTIDHSRRPDDDDDGGLRPSPSTTTAQPPIAGDSTLALPRFLDDDTSRPLLSASGAQGADRSLSRQRTAPRCAFKSPARKLIRPESSTPTATSSWQTTAMTARPTARVRFGFSSRPARRTRPSRFATSPCSRFQAVSRSPASCSTAS